MMLRVTARRKRVLASAVALSEGFLATAQGLLASSLSTDLNELLQATVKGSATIYDKALDADLTTIRQTRVREPRIARKRDLHSSIYPMYKST